MNSLLRRAAQLCFLARRGLTLGVRGAVFDERGRVLLVRHARSKDWHPPGGGVEIGEDAPAALARECEEEACVRLTATPVLHGIFHKPAGAKRDHVLVYVARSFVVLGPKRPDLEIAAAGFFPLDELPSGTTRGTRARLAEITGRAPPTIRW